MKYYVINYLFVGKTLIDFLFGEFDTKNQNIWNKIKNDEVIEIYLSKIYVGWSLEDNELLIDYTSDYKNDLLWGISNKGYFKSKTIAQQTLIKGILS